MNCPGIEPPRKHYTIRPGGRIEEVPDKDSAGLTWDSDGRVTVHRADLFGNVTNTRQTEAELNGWRETQAQLFERDDYRPKPEPDIDPRQGSLL